MRKFLYTSLMDHLLNLKDDQSQPLIKTVDLWNEQVDFLEQEEAFDLPAVFIEIRPIRWKSLSGNIQQSTAELRFHVLTPAQGNSRKSSTFLNESLRRFDLLDRMDEHIQLFQARDERNNSVCMVQRIESATNHNHEEIIEDIEVFTMLLTQNLKIETAAVAQH